MSKESNDLVYQPYVPEDNEKMITLLVNAFGDWPPLKVEASPVDYFQWKYSDNPIRLYTGMVCQAGEKLVASTHTFMYNFKIGDRSIIGGLGADSCVHTAYRRRGIYNQILEKKMAYEKQNGVEFRFHISSNKILIERSKRLEEKKTGTRIPFPHHVVQMVKIYDINKHIKHEPPENPLVIKFGYLGSRILNWLLTPIPKTQKNDIAVKEFQCFDESFNLFWKEVEESSFFVVKKTVDYANWRYSDPRTNIYVKYGAYQDGNLVGYIICTINKGNEDYPKGYIVDLTTTNGQEAAVKKLVETAQSYFHDNGVNIIQFLTVKGGLYEKYFKEYGFLDSRIHWYLFYHTYVDIPETESLSKIDPRKIHISFENFDYN